MRRREQHGENAAAGTANKNRSLDFKRDENRDEIA
jgi:hypothetical protein